MARTDLHSSDAECYECPNCGFRAMSSGARPTCPDCGEEMRNIALPRE